MPKVFARFKRLVFLESVYGFHTGRAVDDVNLAGPTKLKNALTMARYVAISLSEIELETSMPITTVPKDGKTFAPRQVGDIQTPSVRTAPVVALVCFAYHVAFKKLVPGRFDSSIEVT